MVSQARLPLVPPERPRGSHRVRADFARPPKRRLQDHLLFQLRLKLPQGEFEKSDGAVELRARPNKGDVSFGYTYFERHRETARLSQ
jgi:hypothetical protein